MSSKEKQPEPCSESSEPRQPSVLPPELVDFLKDRPFACLMQGTDKGTVFVIKAPARDIESTRGRVPINVRHELYTHPSAPVIRTVLKIYDQPKRPLACETFTNVENEQQRSDFAALAQQKSVLILLYDEALQHRLTKQVAGSDDDRMLDILHRADQLLATIPKER